MPRNSKLKLNSFVSDLVECCVKVLVAENALPADQAHELMLRAAKDICFLNAKSTVYIPEAKSLNNLARNVRIWQAYRVDGPAPACTRKFSSARTLELAVEFDLSPQQVYNICKSQREADSPETAAA